MSLVASNFGSWSTPHRASRHHPPMLLKARCRHGDGNGLSSWEETHLSGDITIRGESHDGWGKGHSPSGIARCCCAAFDHLMCVLTNLDGPVAFCSSSTRTSIVHRTIKPRRLAAHARQESRGGCVNSVYQRGFKKAYCFQSNQGRRGYTLHGTMRSEVGRGIPQQRSNHFMCRDLSSNHLQVEGGDFTE